MHELFTPENIGPIIIDRKLYPNGYLVLIARDCPAQTAELIHQGVADAGIAWLKPAVTCTERQIYFSTDGLVVAKRKVRSKSADVLDSQRSIVNEFRATMQLAKVVGVKPKSFCRILSNQVSISCDVEKPYGAVINLCSNEKYLLFSRVLGVSGQELHRLAEPPMEGTSFADFYSWQLWSGIRDQLEGIRKIAKENFGLTLGDFDVHQTIYNHDKEGNRLSIVLIDADRHFFDKHK